jgi:two-component system chemotaxis response regulator CheB
MADPGDSRHDLVVIGASAGGVETLKRVVAGLPSDLRAAICIVLHVAPGSPSALASILRRAGELPCQPAGDGDPLRLGEILVAPPDHHLLIEDGRVRLTVGPRENNHRPAVDVLFRSAAAERGSRVIGIVLSGTRDDGTAGLAVIKANGGATIVQDPSEALYSGMPASAVAHVGPDAVLPSNLIADKVVSMVNGESLPPDPPRSDSPGGTDPPDKAGPEKGMVTVCPECGGVLSEDTLGGMTQWRCRIGHRYSPESLADAQADGVEAALWAAVRALEDRCALLERMAEQADSRGAARSARSFRRRARDAVNHADAVRATLTDATATTLRRVAEAGGAEAADEEEVA